MKSYLPLILYFGIIIVAIFIPDEIIKSLPEGVRFGIGGFIIYFMINWIVKDAVKEAVDESRESMKEIVKEAIEESRDM